MLIKLIISLGIMSICVMIHAVGVTAALRRYSRAPVLNDPRLWRQTSLLIRLAAWLILLHLLAIAAWAALYTLGSVMPDTHAAFYWCARPPLPSARPPAAASPLAALDNASILR